MESDLNSLWLNLDILDCDSKIRTFFSNEIKNYDEWNNISLLKKQMENPDIRSKIKYFILRDIASLQTRIDNISKFHFYELFSDSILTQYIKSITTPLDSVATDDNLDKIRMSYINLLFFFGFSFFVDKEQKSLDKRKHVHNIYCDNCNNAQFIKTEDIYTCKFCCQEIHSIFKSSSSDHKFVLQTKYMYDRKIHFKDCIDQYQGKQNTFIDPKIYTLLTEQLVNHRIIPTDTTISKKKRFVNVTRSHISFFLKELGYTKHYEDVILIHHVLTSIPTDNIEYLESSLLRDFDLLIEQYDILFKDLDRKNFINTQFVLFQLLRKYNYPCKKSDFNILKTSDKKTCHDDICKTLFDVLGWVYTF
jgi:hypothetical protein